MPGWVEIILRALTLLVFLFFITKSLGKKQLSEMNIFEYITGIVLGGIVAIHVTMTNIPIIYAFISMGVWFLISYFVDLLSLKSKTVRDFFQGKSTVVIQDGKIMEDNLKKEKYSSDDLLENLRMKNIFNVADVEFAVIEPSGSLSVMPKAEQKPISPKDLGIKVGPKKPPETVIMDGKMMLEPLANLSLNPNWLETELEKINVTIENVFLGQVDEDGQLTVDLYDDQIVVPNPSEKPLLLATLKKCQADLELFALASENVLSQQMYDRHSKALQETIDRLKPYLNS